MQTTVTPENVFDFYSFFVQVATPNLTLRKHVVYVLSRKHLLSVIILLEQEEICSVFRTFKQI